MTEPAQPPQPVSFAADHRLKSNGKIDLNENGVILFKKYHITKYITIKNYVFTYFKIFV